MAKDAISGSFDCVVTPFGRSVSAQDDRVKGQTDPRRFTERKEHLCGDAEESETRPRAKSQRPKNLIAHLVTITVHPKQHVCSQEKV
jgi:hypothetical protein